MTTSTVQAERSFNVGAVTPIVTAPSPSAGNLPVPVRTANTLPALPPRSSVRDVAVYGGLNLMTVAGAGAAAYVGGSGLALVVASLVAAAATGFTMVRLLAGKSPEARITAALETERRALEQTSRVVSEQATAIAAEREGLKSDRERVAAEGRSLVEARAQFDQQVRQQMQDAATQRSLEQQALADQLTRERADIAAKVAEGTKRGVKSGKEELARDRAAFEQERELFEQRKKTLMAPVIAEVAALEQKEIQAINAAIERYSRESDDDDTQRYGFVIDMYTSGSGDSFAENQLLDSDRVLNALMTHGKVVAGPLHDSDDERPVVHDGNGSTIMTVNELRQFLRAATGRKI